MALELDTADRRALKKRAHHLKPIVTTGAAGLSQAVLAELDRALNDHELVKIKLAEDDRDARRAAAEHACDMLDAALVQQIGRTATLYRPRPDDHSQSPRSAYW